MFDKSGVQIHIDRVSSFRSDPMEISILGWCWTSQYRLTQLRLESETHSAPCLTELPRPDVAAHFGDPNASYAGIACRVQAPDIPNWVRLVAEVDGELQTLLEVPVPVDGPVGVSTGAVSTFAEWLVFCEPNLFNQAGPPRIEGPQDPPLVSILLPAHESPLFYLHRSIVSVLRQRHPSWELCIACDPSADPELRSYLARYEESDPRIKTRFVSIAGGTSHAFNTGLSFAVGRYIVPLAPGDELHPAALLEMALFLEEQPETEVLYSDEDQIDDEGHPSSPLFKPAFDPDLLLAFNYIGHPIAIRRDLMERVGGYRTECDSVRDWDLLLRISEISGAGSIRHLPKPLYHARGRRDSGEMPDAPANRKVLEDHMTRTKRSGSVQEGLFPGSMRLSLKPISARRTAVIYRSEDGVHQLQAIRRTRSAGLELYELTADTLRRVCCTEARVTTWQDLECDVVVVVNAPIEYLNHAFFEVLNDCAQGEDCGLVGPLVLGPDGRVLSAGLLRTSSTGLLDPFSGISFLNRGYMGLAKATHRVAAVSSHCFAVSKTRFCGIVGVQAVTSAALAGIHEQLVQSAHADGLKVLYSPYAVAALAASPAAGTIAGDCVGLSVPGVNPNIEAFASMRAIFEQEILS